MKKILAVILCFVVMIPFIVTVGAVSETNGFLYEKLNSFHAKIVGIFDSSELSQAESIVIPDYVRELLVTQIGQSAFLQNNTVKYITMPESIVQICDSAMYGMKSLKTVTIPKNTAIMGKSVFAYCTALESVKFNTESLSEISEFTFYGCSKLNNVILPNGTVTIGNLAFAQCTGMDKIYIPSSVEHISDTAFDRVNGLTIYSETNSEAYCYAQENSINFVDVSEKSLDGLSESIDTAFYLINYKDTSVYTKETFNAFLVAYENAVAVKENFFSLSADVETAKTNLDNAYYSLRLNSMNDLDEAIIQAESTVAASFRYTESSVNDLEKAIHQARTVQNTVLPSETQVQNAIQNLNRKINALVRITENDTRAVLKGCSISLEGDIAINFYMQLDSTVIDSESAYMQFTIPKGETTEIKKVYLKDAFLKEETGENCYLFKCRVAPKEMNSRVKAQFFADGIGGTEYTYSVKNYAYYILAHTEISQYAQAENIVKAMLNYGAYSQLYFDENPDVLVNENLTDEEKYIDDVTAQTVNKPYDSTVQNHLSDGVTFAGATVSLKSKTVLSLYFQSENTLTFSCQEKTLTTAESNGYQIVRINDIAAKEIGDDFTVTVTADGNSGTVIYSPLNYCYNALQTNDNEKLCQVVKALYKYWQAADSYFV